MTDYKNGKDTDSAIEVYRKAVHLIPDEPTYMESLGAALAEKKQIDEALTIFEKSLSIDKLNPMTYYSLGNIHVFDLKQPEKALSYYKEVVTLDPDFPNGYLNLGNTYASLGHHLEAIEAYKKEIFVRPKSHLAFINLGYVYKLLGKVSEARTALKSALTLEPSSKRAKELQEQLGKAN